MHITVNEELKAYIDPLTPDEHAALERSILAEGCRDALVLWGDVLVDGHNRYGICQKHGLPFQTVQNTRFASMEDVHLWMIEQHLGRRSVSDFQRGVLALRQKDIVAERRARAAASSAGSTSASRQAASRSMPLPPWPACRPKNRWRRPTRARTNSSRRPSACAKPSANPNPPQKPLPTTVPPKVRPTLCRPCNSVWLN